MPMLSVLIAVFRYVTKMYAAHTMTDAVNYSRKLKEVKRS
jgi:hypothetical protein